MTTLKELFPSHEYDVTVDFVMETVTIEVVGGDKKIRFEGDEWTEVLRVFSAICANREATAPEGFHGLMNEHGNYIDGNPGSAVYTRRTGTLE